MSIAFNLKVSNLTENDKSIRIQLTPDADELSMTYLKASVEAESEDEFDVALREGEIPSVLAEDLPRKPTKITLIRYENLDEEQYHDEIVSMEKMPYTMSIYVMAKNIDDTSVIQANHLEYVEVVELKRDNDRIYFVPPNISIVIDGHRGKNISIET